MGTVADGADDFAGEDAQEGGVGWFDVEEGASVAELIVEGLELWADV